MDVLVSGFVALGVMLGVLLVPGLAAAQADEDARAQALFAEAVEAVERGELDGAARLFAASLELAPRPTTALNLAEVELRRGLVTEARARARAIVSDAFGVPSDRVRALATAILADSAERVMVLVLEGDAPVTRVDIEDAPTQVERLSSTQVAIELDPGRRRLTIWSGSTSTEELVDAVAGTRRTLALNRRALEASPAPALLPPPERPSRFARRLGLTLAALALVGALTIVVVAATRPTERDPVWGSAQVLSRF